MEQKPAGNQFTIELNVIHDAFVLQLGVDAQEIPQFNKMKLVLAKVAALIKTGLMT